MCKLLLTLVLFVPLCGQQPPAQEGKGPRPPMPEPKNLKVLKMPAAELIPLMRVYSKSLGVQCVFCHVQNDYASDEKPQKETARKMIVMAKEINEKYMEGEPHVGCYTCHHGEKEPAGAPPAETPAAAPKPPAR